MVLSSSRAVFQLRFGSKQARPSHTPPLVTVDPVSDPVLCPVDHIRHYLQEHLYKNIFSPLHYYDPTAQTSILCCSLSMAAQNTRGDISYPAGSTRTAAASFALAHRVSIPTILSCGDWAKAKTVMAHYIRRVPGSGLQAVAYKPNATPPTTPPLTATPSGEREGGGAHTTTRPPAAVTLTHTIHAVRSLHADACRHINTTHGRHDLPLHTSQWRPLMRPPADVIFLYKAGLPLVYRTLIGSSSNQELS